MEDQRVFAPRVAELLIDSNQDREPRASVLTLREIDVFYLIGEGLTNREITVQMNLTENSVKILVKEFFPS